MVVSRKPVFDDANQFVVGRFAIANGQMQPSFDAGAHQLLGVGQRDVVHCDRNIVFVGFLDDCEI